MSRYENYEIKNNVFGALSAPISSLATTIQLGDGQGQRFSVNMLATLENVENGKVMKREIVLITAINGDVLTVERKYAPCPVNDDANTQGKVSYAFSTDDTISAYIDKEHFDNIKLALNDLMDNGNDRLYTTGTGGLNIYVTEGNARVGVSEIYFAGGTAVLTDNTTNYVMLTGAGNIVVSTTGWNTDFCKLAVIETSNGEIVGIIRRKMDTVGGVMSAKAGFKNVSNCVYDYQGFLISFVADSVQYNLTYENGAVKTITFGETTYTMTYSMGKLVSIIES